VSEKKRWLRELNRIEEMHCEKAKVPYSGGFRTFREAMNYLEDTQEPTVFGREMLQKGREIRKKSYFGL